MTNPNFGMSKNDTIAAAVPIIANTRPRVPEASAVRQTLRNECGFGGAGGTITYRLRAIQRTNVEMNISAPGMPKRCSVRTDAGKSASAAKRRTSRN